MNFFEMFDTLFAAFGGLRDRIQTFLDNPPGYSTFSFAYDSLLFANDVIPIVTCILILMGGHAAAISIRLIRWGLTFVPFIGN